jgi:hypothetical protein
MYMWRDVLYGYEVTVGSEGSRSLGLVNGSLVSDYILRYCSTVQVDQQPNEGLSRHVWRVADCI